MPTLTPKLGLKLPLGNETVSRAAYNENLNIIDQNATSQAQMNEPFYLKSAKHNPAANQIDLVLGPGQAAFLENLIVKTGDTDYAIHAPQPEMNYYVFLKSDGTFALSASGAEVTGAVPLWKVTTASTVGIISVEDRRGNLPGAAARIVQDNLNSHKNQAVLDHPDSSIVTAKIVDGNITTAKLANSSVTTAKIADGNVIDAKIGNRTITDTMVPTVDTANLTTLLNNIGNMLKQITGKANWRTSPARDLEEVNTHINAASPHTGHVLTSTTVTGSGGLTGGGALSTNVALSIADSGVTDAKIGNRTVNQALAGVTNTGTLSQLLSWIAKTLNAITGKTNWYDLPTKSLEQLNNEKLNKSGDTMTGGLIMDSLNARLELGKLNQANTPYIDFHSSGNYIDYDVRLVAAGGNANSGNGGLHIAAAALVKYATATGYGVSAGTGYTIVDEYCRLWRAVFNDLAEMMPCEGNTEPGDVCIWDETIGALKKATIEDDPRVVGVYSDSYGFLLGGPVKESPEDIDGYIPIGLCGQIWVKAKGVKAGQLLTSSNVPGVAKASSELTPGSVFAKALESAPDEEVKRIRALIMVR